MRSADRLVAIAAIVLLVVGLACADKKSEPSLAFVSDRDGKPEIFVMLANSSRPQRVTNGQGDDYFWLTWAPDGQRLAFTARKNDGSSEVYVWDAQTASPPSLVSGGFSITPAWSADGRLALASNFEIHVVNADGSDNSKLTDVVPGRSYAGQPAWSPDGQRIVFSAGYHQMNDIYVMNADGSEKVRLTNDERGNDTPSWSPDGSRGPAAQFVATTISPRRRAQ